MDKICFLVKREDTAIDNSSSVLNDEDMFGSPCNWLIAFCEEELNVFWESRLQVKDENLFLCFIFCVTSLIYFLLNQSDSDEQEMSLSSMIKQVWMKSKELLEHDFAVPDWALSILPIMKSE